MPETLAGDEAVRLAKRLLEEIGLFPSGRGTVDTPLPFFYAAGFLARAKGLLRGMAALLESGDEDCVGVLYRPLLEGYFFGIYAALGGDEACLRIKAALDNHAHRLNKAFGRSDPNEGPSDRRDLTAKELADKVDELLDVYEPGTQWARQAYHLHYRTISFHDTHGGLGSLQGYIGLDGATPFVASTAGRPWKAAYLTDIAIPMVATLAAVVLDLAGRDTTGVANALGEWEKAPRAQSIPPVDLLDPTSPA